MSTVGPGLRATAVLGGVATTAGLLYLLYSNYQKARSGQLDIPREVALKVLKELRRDLYPVFKKILKAAITMRQTARQQRRNRRGPAGDPMAGLDKIELCEMPEFREMILGVEDRVYAKYNIESKQVFEKFCLALQRTDAEVNRLMTEIGDMYAQAKGGDPIRLDFAAPEQISELAVLKAQKEIYVEMLRALTQSMLAGGAGETEEEMRIAHRHLEEALEAVLRHNGFDVMEDYHAEGVFEQATAKFLRINPDFKRKMTLLEQNFHNVVNQLLTNRLPVTRVVEEFSRVDRFLDLAAPPPVIEVVAEPQPVEAAPLLNPANLELAESGLLAPPLNPSNLELAEYGLLTAPPSLKPNVIEVIELADAHPTVLFATRPPAGEFPHPRVQLSAREDDLLMPASAVSSTPFVVLAPSQSLDAPFHDLTTSHADEDKSPHF